MLFHTIDFAIFLPIVFFLYWGVFSSNLKAQNSLIVFASYIFYGWWDWRFLSLLFFSSVLDFWVGQNLAKSNSHIRRKILLGISVIVNLGLLCIFKYFNFFQANLVAAFSIFGLELNSYSLNVVLPVGISFYTFQTLSYSIDIYRKKLSPSDNFIAFSAYVSFFPQLVAGPIERATNLLPQFLSPRKFDYSKAVDGLRQILWGLFKKMVIADNCAVYANLVFNNSDQYNGSSLFLGAMFFAFQIYGDFSGYSDIAIGISRLFGFNLMRNFAYPYFSRDVAEFWRRWHISLSTWFRDYLYIPLGGSVVNTGYKVRNTFIVFVVSGFWHGANWTFIIWGALNAIFMMPSIISNSNRRHLEIVAPGRLLPTLHEFASIVLTFTLTIFSWVVFRANSVTHAISYFSGMFSLSLFSIPDIEGKMMAAVTILFILILLTFEWLGRNDQYGIQKFAFNWPMPIRWSFYYFLILLIFSFSGKQQDFIYFQF